MKSKWIGVIQVLAIAGVLVIPSGIAVAVGIDVTDGRIGDWGVNVDTTTGIYSAANPGNNAFATTKTGVSSWIQDGYDPSNWGQLTGGAGYGGQNFDMEAMYTYYGTGAQGTGLYMAVVTGFDPGGVWDWNGGAPQIRPGDIFIYSGASTSGAPKLAIETSGLKPTEQDPQPWAAGGTVGAVYTGTGTWWTNGAPYPVGYDTIGPAEIVQTTGGAGKTPATLAGALSGNAYFNYTDVVRNGRAYAEGDTAGIAGQYDNQDNPGAAHPYASGSGGNQYDHNVVEAFLSESLLSRYGINPTGGSIAVGMYMTEQCGNDAVSLAGTYAEVVTPPVPEPLSMVMLGCLGAGMFGARKAKRLMSKAAKQDDAHAAQKSQV
ncbi:MAG: hypothetical protein NTU83_03580 [Candidatus Hydrogenedentes bacterium]|nr:hypothetical protein [Candidatus Hydrogenedentota bacterium]